MPNLLISGPDAVCAGMALFGAASVLGLLRPTPRFGLSGLLSVLASALCLVGALFGSDGVVTLGPNVGVAGVEVAFRLDSLSRWFVALIAIVALASSAYLPGYLSHLRGKARPGLVWSGFALLLGSMFGVVAAANAVVFFVFWELMAVSSFLLVATEHEVKSVRRAAFIYLGATRIGSAFLVAGFFWMHAVTGTWDMAAWTLSGERAAGPAALMLVGLLAKAGSWPFHLWLPIAHPVAPGPVSAVMSGAMIKTAVYGIARVFVLGGVETPWLGWTLVVLGAVSAIWGILFALLQHDLKRLLAYSSVENIGLVTLAFGVSIVASNEGLAGPAGLALGAALFHSLNHAVFKSLLFLGASTVDANAHTREMDRLGGLVHKMPWTAATFFVGAAAICALAPLNGFASEWLLYRGLFQMGSTASSPETRFVALLILGWVGLVGALALACFTKAFGVAFLGRPRSGEAAHAKEAEGSMVAACGFLAALCLALGVFAPWVWSALGRLGLVASPEPWSLPIVATAGLGLAIALVVWGWMDIKAKGLPARTFITWDCGFGPLPARAQYTAASFVQPIARIFGALYRYETAVVVEGDGHRQFPTEVRAETRHESYLESKVYAPGLSAVQKFSEGFLMRLQAGSIHQYLLFMVLTLVLLFWMGGVL